MGKTITQALKDLFLAIGGNSSALADNSDISDYIADVETALKAGILPEVSASDNGKIMGVADGKWKMGTLTAIADTSTGVVTFTFTPDAET